MGYKRILIYLWVYILIMMTDNYFYFLPEQIAHFEVIQPTSCIPTECIKCNQNSEAITQALKYRYPMKYLGKESQKITIECIPALELQVTQYNTFKTSLPCLIKTNKETSVKGYLSGRRSAILCQNNKLYRYKGCGNDGEGFIVSNNQLRGCHYYHTAKRELFMTKMVNDILKEEIGQESANIPLFFYQFPKNIKELGLKDQLKLLNKYCCVFQTWGDRRIGTHLISPLQIIFLNVVDFQGIDLPTFFKEKERADNFGLTELLIDFQMNVEKGQKFIEVFQARPEFNNYVTLDELKKKGEVKQVSAMKEIMKKLGHKFSKGNQQQIGESLINYPNLINAIQTILQKVGWQMGQIKRIFCKRGINWGFFNDHNTWHCNAHLNNFVFSHPFLNKRFIKPLDFDLAFTKDQYINIDLDSDKYGERDDDNFEMFLMAEFNAMEMSISGVEIMNFKYSIDEEDKQPPLLTKMARVIFRDTLIRSFRRGMRNDTAYYQKICQNWNQHILTIHKIVQTCLLLSVDFQT